MHQHASAKHDSTGEGCGHSSCGCHAGEFTRLRYFFGQHLGVVDFNDQQAYDVGKHHFANRHLHGAGVLCGLRAERMLFPQGSDPTTKTALLRVTRGAAIDGCGREVLVAVDQCIDINGWLAKHRDNPDVQAWNADHPATLWIGLRYRECPSGPAPAPRDPCGCDSGGCEYSRVLEGFELALLTVSEIADVKGDSFPSSNDLMHAIEEPDFAGGRDFGITALHRRITSLVSADCPSNCCGEWLLLASVSLEVDASTPQQILVITAIELSIPQRRTLLSTSALQALVDSLIEAEVGTGRLAKGPRITGPLHFSATGADSGQLFLDVRLIEEGTPAAETPLVETTIDPTFVTVTKFDPASKAWQVVPTTTSYQPSRFSIELSSLIEGSYRLLVSTPTATPIVDEQLRPLLPFNFITTFKLNFDTDGFLHIDSTSAD